MRHRVKGKKLNRDVQHRRALFLNLITSLVSHGHITTTEAKAKAIRGEVDKLVAKAKQKSLHQRRQIEQVFGQRQIVNKLVDEIAPLTKRSSGFTRFTRLGRRTGDNAMMVKLEFVDQVIPASEPKKSATKKSTKTKVVKTPIKKTAKTSARSNTPKTRSTRSEK